MIVDVVDERPNAVEIRVDRRNEQSEPKMPLNDHANQKLAQEFAVEEQDAEQNDRLLLVVEIEGFVAPAGVQAAKEAVPAVARALLSIDGKHDIRWKIAR